MSSGCTAPGGASEKFFVLIDGGVRSPVKVPPCCPEHWLSSGKKRTSSESGVKVTQPEWKVKQGHEYSHDCFDGRNSHKKMEISEWPEQGLSHFKDWMDSPGRSEQGLRSFFSQKLLGESNAAGLHTIFRSKAPELAETPTCLIRSRARMLRKG